MKHTKPFAAFFAIVAVAVTIGVTAAQSAEAPSPSPVKAFVDLPDTYGNIVAGCIGVNGFYVTQGVDIRGVGGQMQIIQNDPNCVRGRTLNL